MNEAVRRKRRSARARSAGLARLALMLLVAASPALGAVARAQAGNPVAAGSAAVSDSLSAGRVDELLRAWSRLYLNAWSDSLQGAWFDSLTGAWSDSLTGAGSDSLVNQGSAAALAAGGAAGHVMLVTGCEVEGLEESFGQESLVSLPTAASAATETPASSADTTAASVRFAERTTALLGVLGLRARTDEASANDAGVDFQSRIGDRRANVTAEVHAGRRSGPGRGLSVRDLFLWDRADDGSTSHQNLLFLRWRPRLGPSGWRLDLGSSLEVSRSADADIELEPGAGAPADSVLRLTYLNYEKYGLRMELWREGLHGSALALEFSRKEVRGDGSGSYASAALSVNRTWLLAPGLLDLDLDVRRRHYDVLTSVFGSYWEPELHLRWLGAGVGQRIDAQVRALATLHDDSGALDEDDLLGFAGDQLIVEVETLLRRSLVAGADRIGARGPGWEWEAGLGPVARLVRTRGGEGDAGALGARLETELRRPRGPSAWWIDGSVELGWRKYREQQLEDRLAFEGFTLSLAQSDYRYCQLSLLGGGDLPWSLAWEAYLSLDQEWHSLGADDARLVSFSLALKRLWVLWAHAGPRSARPH